MTLIDVLLHEQLRDIFTEAARTREGLNAGLIAEHPEGVDDPFGGRGAVVRVRTRAGESLLVNPRGVFREVGQRVDEIAAFNELVGYDWISRELADKVAEKEEHYDRLYLDLRGQRTVVLDRLGDAVYPLLTYLAKVLELRSQKVILRGLDDGVAELVGRCLRAAAEGPFFTDPEVETLFSMDRPSLTILASMWQRMNLAAPDLGRAVGTIMEMLLQRRGDFPDAWDERIGATPERVEAALVVFRRVVAEEV